MACSSNVSHAMLLGGWSARDGAQPEAGAMQQMIDGHCSDTRLHEHRIVMRDAGKVDVTVWGNISSGVTERLMPLDLLILGALHHEPCHINVGLNARTKGAVLHTII